MSQHLTPRALAQAQEQLLEALGCDKLEEVLEANAIVLHGYYMLCEPLEDRKCDPVLCWDRYHCDWRYLSRAEIGAPAPTPSEARDPLWSPDWVKHQLHGGPKPRGKE